MSHVSDVLLVEGYDSNFAAQANAWLLSRDCATLTQIDLKDAGGTKYMSTSLWAAGLNHFPVSDFIAALSTFDAGDFYDQTFVTITTEDAEVIIWRPSK